MLNMIYAEAPYIDCISLEKYFLEFHLQNRNSHFVVGLQREQPQHTPGDFPVVQNSSLVCGVPQHMALK